MNTEQHQPRGMFFEEFTPGLKITTAGRTITEADVVNFAGLSGDFNQLHVDQEYAQGTPFGARVAHGLLVLSIVSGLAVMTGVLEGTVLAFREVSEWKFSKPVYIGDTIHAVLEVQSAIEVKRLRGGSVEIKVGVFNQHGDIVQKGIWVVLVQSRSNGS